MAAGIRSSLAQAVVTMLAILATIAVCLLIAPEPGPAVLGAMLCLTLSRSQLERDWRGRLEAGIALPFIGVLSAGVGHLLLDLPIVGAIVYVVGMFLSILLRRFGPVPRRIGALLAIPFIALLVAPNPVPSTVRGGLAVLVPALVAVVSFAFVTLFQVAAIGIRMLPRPVPAEPESARPDAARPDAARPDTSTTPKPGVILDATTKLALQMALSLAAAFAIGFVFFPTRWAWIVLTVVVVAVGNAGRADVLYKGIQRVLGAAVGTVVALLGLTLPTLGGPNLPTVIVLLAIVFVAVLLRPFAYLWWALFFTLALTLLQSFGAPSASSLGPLLGERLEEILLGTALALLVAWFVAPVRSENTVRRRIGLVLAALQTRLAEQTPETARALAGAEKDLAKVAAPYDAWRRFFRRSTHPRAALWIATTRESVALGRDGGSVAARSALGEARKALRDPDRLQAELARVRAALAGEVE